MSPDLNSLLPSQVHVPTMMQTPLVAATTNDSHHDSGFSHRPSTHSLAAAATMNAAERRSSNSRGSPRLDRTASGRRRSRVAMNLSLNDPTLPASGELSSSDQRSSVSHVFSTASPASIGGRQTISTGDPNHHRQPSLGDIHNELEQEQEAQVNRMLSLIRDQQHQLDTLQAQQLGEPPTPSSQSAVVEDITPQSERSFSFPSVHPAVGSVPRPTGRLSRQSSSANRSPALRPLPSQEIHNDAWPPSPISTHRDSSDRRSSMRDETAYYQAEQSNLQRENQMLKLRIRELEKQLHERQSNSLSTSVPAHHSNLVTSPPLEAQRKD